MQGPSSVWRFSLTIAALVIACVYLVFHLSQSLRSCATGVHWFEADRLALCTLFLIDKHNGLVSSIGTLIVAGFTFTLWRSTERLWKSAEDQRDSDRAARRDDEQRFSESLSLAERSAKAAEEASHNERAWIYFEKFEHQFWTNCVFDDVGYPQADVFRVLWRNGGRSPAFFVRIWIDKILSVGESLPSFSPRFVENSAAVIGPGAERYSGSVCLVGDDFVRARSSATTLWLYGRVEYKDVYSKELRHSEVTVRVRYSGVRTDPNGESLNLLFQPMGPQNTCS